MKQIYFRMNNDAREKLRTLQQNPLLWVKNELLKNKPKLERQEVFELLIYQLFEERPELAQKDKI